MDVERVGGADLDQIWGLSDLGKEQPKELWIAGNWRQVLGPGIAAVIGSRRMTHYGRTVIDLLVTRLIQSDQKIMSGFMYGVDMAAHQETVQRGGQTIVVLGWGIETPTERADQAFLERIVASGGVVISEWQNQKGALWTFPRRNRIVAALATEVFVVEAGEKSGSLITVDWAIKLKRTVWAVPGPVTSKVSQGTNRLLRDGDARLWMPNDIDGHRSQAKLNGLHAEVVTLLQNEILDANTIARGLGKSMAEISAVLMQLQLSGIVEEREGTYRLANG